MLAIVLAMCDVVATILEGELSTVDGIKPYWKLSLTFKCLTDAIMLDDFATELRRIGADQRLPGHIKENKLQEDPQVDNDTLPMSQAREIQYPAAAKTQSTGKYDSDDEIEDVGGLAR